jgi:two-component sensor histidine kinase
VQCLFGDVAADGGDGAVAAGRHGGPPELEPIWPAIMPELTEGRTVVVRDARTDPRTSALQAATTQAPSTRACVVVPLARDNAWAAVFAAIAAAPRNWTARETTLIQAIGEKAWLWAEQLRAVQTLNDLNRDLERRVAERTRDLQNSVREKEVLLKEIHHRVKNNLQVIVSLLNLQSHYIEDAVARAAFNESQGRVRSIALVHEKLYQSKDVASVGFDEYVRMLVDSLCTSFGADRRGISREVEIRDDVRLGVDTAIPCGLMINELVTNALKHAFPDGRGGCVRVMMQRGGADQIELEVGDDGVGLPPDIDLHNSRSLGLDLVFTFAQQLQARTEVRRDGGTAFLFRFGTGQAHPLG